MKTVITSQQLQGLRAGDHKAFEEIYHALHARIYSYCNRFLRDAGSAEEATADAFVILWQKREIIDLDQPIEAFMYKVARDRSLNYLNKIANNNKLKENYITDYQTSDVSNKESKLIDQERLSLLHNKISKLPPQQEKVFRMRYMESLSNQVIAENLDISINTVKAHLLQARRSIRDMF